MENQIELPYNLIQGYTNGSEGSCNLLSGEYFATSSNSFIPWCNNSFPSPYDHHKYSSNNAITSSATSNAFQLPYNHGGVFYNHVPISSSAGLASMMMNNSNSLAAHGSSVVSTLFGTIHAEIGKMTAQEIMDAKALAASKSHSEAERRRRERINGHLAKLRSMLPNTTKTDKASLLAEVIQHVKELKRQTSEIAEESPLPSEADELTVNPILDEDGNLIVRATLCCEDRIDLLPDLIKALKALKLRTLKAEITTVGGRFRNVLLIAVDNISGDADQRQQSITAIQEALKVVVEQSSKQDSCSSSAGGTKRQRTNSLSSSSRCD